MKGEIVNYPRATKVPVPTDSGIIGALSRKRGGEGVLDEERIMPDDKLLKSCEGRPFF